MEQRRKGSFTSRGPLNEDDRLYQMTFVVNPNDPFPGFKAVCGLGRVF